MAAEQGMEGGVKGSGRARSLLAAQGGGMREPTWPGLGRPWSRPGRRPASRRRGRAGRTGGTTAPWPPPAPRAAPPEGCPPASGGGALRRTGVRCAGCSRRSVSSHGAAAAAGEPGGTPGSASCAAGAHPGSGGSASAGWDGTRTGRTRPVAVWVRCRRQIEVDGRLGGKRVPVARAVGSVGGRRQAAAAGGAGAECVAGATSDAGKPQRLSRPSPRRKPGLTTRARAPQSRPAGRPTRPPRASMVAAARLAAAPSSLTTYPHSEPGQQVRRN